MEAPRPGTRIRPRARTGYREPVAASLIDGIEASAVVPQDLTLGIVGDGELQEGIDRLRIAGINVWIVGREDEMAAELLHQVEGGDLVGLDGYDTLPPEVVAGL